MSAFGWSYPPGVTGNEYEIAGPDWEGTLEVTCPNEEARLEVVSKDVAEILDEYRTALLAENGDEVFRQLRALKNQIAYEVRGTVTAPCPFVGEVDAAAFRGQTWWTCPVCGAENEEEAEDDFDPPEPDPDAWMDAQDRYEKQLFGD